MSDHPDSERAAVSRQALDAVVAKICGGEARYLLNLNRYEPTPGLQDVQVIGQYLRVVERFGWEVLAPATEVIVRESIHNLEPAVDFLSTMMAAGIELKQAANLQLGQDSLKKLSVVAERFHRYYASKFVDALLNEEDPPFVPGPSSSPPARRHDFVENLMKALDSLAFSGDVKKAVVAHFFATPKLHDLDETLLPAVEGLLEHLGSHFKGGSWFLQLYWRCMDALETRCVKPPPLDVWVLPTACACACRGCRQLVQFCMDPFRVQIELPCPGRDAKEHLIDSVQR